MCGSKQGGKEPPGQARGLTRLFTAIQSEFESFSLFQNGAIQILEVSGCFTMAGPVFQDGFSVVQDGSGRLSGCFRVTVYFQSTFSLLSIGILHGSSGWFQDVSVVLVPVGSVVSGFSLFQVSAVQNKSFSRLG